MSSSKKNESRDLKVSNEGVDSNSTESWSPNSSPNASQKVSSAVAQKSGEIISAENDDKLGSKIQAKHVQLSEVYEMAEDSSAEVQKIREIGRKLEAPAFKGKIKYKIIYNSKVNAFACGDTVYIYSGLINKLETEAMIAAVLAHEITHIEKDHARLRNDSNSITSKLSLLRVHEYTADATVAEKLDNAGYNAAVQGNTLDLLSAEFSGKKIDFDHGSWKDRSSIILTQLKFRDYQSTSVPDSTQKPESLKNLPCKPHFFDFIVERIAKYHNFYKEIPSLSPLRILEFHKYLLEMIDNIYKDNNKNYDVSKIIQIIAILKSVDREVRSRISQKMPELDEKAQMWMQLILYTELSEHHLDQIEQILQYIIKDFSKRTYEDFNYISDLINSIQSPADLKSFVLLAKEQSGIEKLGYHPSNNDFPKMIFNSRNIIDDTDIWFFCRLMNNFRDLENIEVNFDLIEEIGQLLGTNEKNEQAQRWVVSKLIQELEIKIDMITGEILDKDADLDKTKAIIKYAPEFENFMIDIINIGLMRIKKYVSKSGFFYHYKISQVGYVNRALYSNLPPKIRNHYFDEFRIKFQRSEDPKLDTLITLFEAQNIGAIIEFIRQNGISTFIQKYEEGNLMIKNIEFPFVLNQAVSHYLKSNNEIALEDTEYLLKIFRSNEFLHFFMEEKIRNLKSISDLESELGINKAELNLILQIKAEKIILFGGDESKTFQKYLNLIQGINLQNLSPNGKIIILWQLIDYPNLRLYSHIGWQNQDASIDWAQALTQKNFIDLRDHFLATIQRELNSEYALVQTSNYLKSDLKKAFSYYKKQNSLNYIHDFFSPVMEYVMVKITSMNIDTRSVEDLKRLYEIITLLDDERIVQKLKREIELSLVKLMSFDEASEYLMGLIKNSDLPLKAIDWYQENLICTPEQIKKAGEIMAKYGDKLNSEGSITFGSLFGMDYVFENYLSKHSLEIFEAALESRTNDTKLRQIISILWYEKNKSFFKKFLENRNNLAEMKMDSIERNNFQSFEDFLEYFYTNITQTEIDILLRKILISSEGILMTSEGKSKLKNLLLKNLTNKAEDQDLAELIGQISEVALDNIDPAKLYHPLASIFRERLFLPPQKPGDNDEARYYILNTYNKTLSEKLSGLQEKIRDPKVAISDRKEAEQQYKEIKEWNAKYNPNNAAVAEFLQFKPSQSDVNKLTDFILREEERNHLLNIVDIEKRKIQENPMEPLEVVLSFSRNMGAVGVRFLQLLGQYVDIPERYQNKFDESYDQIRGQLKFTAFQTLQREATHKDASKELKDFWGNLQHLSPMLAGGSLMTVYSAQMKDGSKKIVKILNPNAEEFIRQNILDARNVAEQLKDKNIKNQANFNLARVLLGDLDKWLTDDINATNYDWDNALFESVNNGFEAEGLEFSSPATLITGTKYVKIEAFIEGKNLLEILQQGDKNLSKLMVSALKSSFQHQLQTIEADGKTRVHSDIHPGNVRLGNDGKLYWIDRGYYLKFTAEEVSLIKPFLEGNFNLQTRMNALDFLLKLPENQGLKINKIKLFTNLAKARIGKSGLNAVNEILLALKKESLHIPIRFSLLFKNIRALDKMAERVGMKD